MNATDLHFRAADHTYWLGGERLPSVSEIIAPLKNSYANGEHARALGLAVHKACELDDLDELDEASVDAQVRPYLDAWRELKRHNVFSFCGVERALHSARLRFAGTPDRVAWLRNGHLGVLDLKSGGLDPVYRIQLAGYALLATENHIPPKRLVKRFVLQLAPNGRPKLHECKSAGDENVFLACLQLHRWKEQHR